jgi:hypothetical protein
MSVYAFTGAAGTGKTRALVQKLESHLSSTAMLQDQRVLALTRMHGSRFRMIERLAKSPTRRVVDCVTIDRFAWELASRWRSRLVELGYSLPSEFEYDATCEAASQLLAHADVLNWVKHRFPIALIDEFQDCHGGRLAMAQGLASKVHMLIAADAFQDLSETGPSSAVEWVTQTAEVEDLTTVHRTSDSGLLAAAHALRQGTPVQSVGNAKFFSAPNANVAASFLARGIAWSAGSEVVVLSPTTSDKSPFVRDCLERLAAKPFEKAGRKYGPYPLHWERSRENLESDLCAKLQLPEDPYQNVTKPSFATGAKLPGQADVEQWIERQRRVRGQVVFSSGELTIAVQRSIQALRAQPLRGTGPRVMTIHQAKNREFENVLILWPVQVPSDAEAQRRLLYNAITRAKKLATVIVQDPKPEKSRLKLAPFLMSDDQ